MIRFDSTLSAARLLAKIERFFDLSAAKIRALEADWNPANGAPVFTVQGRYTSQAWTEWTEGFVYGSALLQFDATGDRWFLDLARRHAFGRQTLHLTDFGVHDHGFNNVSTYGNLLRLGKEGKFKLESFEAEFYRLALKISGAVQAARWSRTASGKGYIHSFNGPHSLFADTIRSLRSLALAHRLGHTLIEEGGRRVSLLERLIHHAATTAEFNVYYGEGRDIYDVPGRVAHESIFNMRDGTYRCASSQQGYSPYSTWTRALAWIICGYAEQLEFVEAAGEAPFEPLGGREPTKEMMLRAALAASDYYLEQAASDGIPYWDTAAPGLTGLGDWAHKPSDPYNEAEPVDSSAAAIAAQGLWRLGKYLDHPGRDPERAGRYNCASLTIAGTLFSEPYLSTSAAHQGLILHSVYHRPRGWDYVPAGRAIPCGESSMWGDYHARELALLLLRECNQEPGFTFFDV
ncbi:MAG: glycosyl hydrolase [Terriglobia bacterium]